MTLIILTYFIYYIVEKKLQKREAKKREYKPTYQEPAKKAV